MKYSSLRASIVFLLALALGVGCVFVSSNKRVPPEPEVDASTEPTDSGPRPDVGELPDSGSLTRPEATRGLLAAIGTNVVLPTYRDLARETEALVAATSRFATSGSDADRDAAREAWRSTIAVAQRAELLQLGPAAMATAEVIGGQSLRDTVYPYPSFSRCRVDVITQRLEYQDLDALAAQPNFVRGLAAIEYLLFFDGTTHGCSAAAAIRVDDAEWAALGPDGIRARRRAHAHALAQLVDRGADALLAAWEPSGGDFAGQLARAGESGSPYPTTQSALNAIYIAMFYVDKQLKDLKVGGPVALTDACEEAPCPELLESQYAGASSAHLLPNLLAFQALYLGAPEGTDAIGFDDLLRVIGEGVLAEQLRAAIANAIAVARTLPTIDRATLGDNIDAVRAFHAAIKGITDLHKADFRTVLDLELPMGAGEDND